MKDHHVEIESIESSLQYHHQTLRLQENNLLNSSTKLSHMSACTVKSSILSQSKSRYGTSFTHPTQPKLSFSDVSDVLFHIKEQSCLKAIRMLANNCYRRYIVCVCHSMFGCPIFCNLQLQNMRQIVTDKNACVFWEIFNQTTEIPSLYLIILEIEIDQRYLCLTT